MSIFLAGDFADPKNEVDYSFINDLIDKESIFLFNLEGPILKEEERTPNNKHKYNLFSTLDFLDKFKNKNIVFSLANNHINDFKNGLNITKRTLNDYNIPFIGVDNQNFYETEIGNEKIGIFSWNSPLTLPYSNRDIATLKHNSFLEVSNYKKLHPETIIIVYAHFGLELSKYPTPADRNWCKSIINAGADYIVAHHPHVIQGMEYYNKGVIFYSIGNFVLPQTNFLDKKLLWNDKRVNKGLIIEIKSKTNFNIHVIGINDDENKVTYSNMISISDLSNLFDYKKGSTDKEYYNFYKKNNRILKHYPVFNTYKGAGFRFKYIYVLLIQLLRKMLIMAGIHNPYKKS